MFSEAWVRWSAELRSKWVRFFCSLFYLEYLSLDRCLRHQTHLGNHGCSSLAMEVISPMVLQPTSDSNLTKVTTAVDLLRQSIDPVNKLSTPPPPQRELNAAVLSKRERKVIEKEMRFNSWNSSSNEWWCFLLGLDIGSQQHIRLVNTRVRPWWIGMLLVESPPCSVSTHRKLWAQVWATEGRTTSWREKDICSTAAVAARFAFIDYWIVWVVARLKNIVRSKTSRAGNEVQITALHLKEAENVYCEGCPEIHWRWSQEK